MRAKAESCLRLFIGSGLPLAPANPDARRANALLCAPPKWGPSAPTTPMGRALRPSTPGDFPVAEKVTKGAPRAAPFGIPRYEVSALFALAALRFGSRRATFYLRPRPICHFEIAGGIGLIFSPRVAEVTPPAFKPWRGSGVNRGVLATHSSRGPIRDRNCWADAQTAQTAQSFPNSSLYISNKYLFIKTLCSLCSKPYKWLD